MSDSMIPLRYKGEVVAHALVDPEDFDEATAYRWHCARGYARRAEHRSEGPNQFFYLHREVLGLTDGRVLCDHINGNRLDNRKSNLRTLTRTQNSQNRLSHVGSSSQYRGVYWSADRQRWTAVCQVNGKDVFLGRFTDEHEAGAAAAAGRAIHMPFSREAMAA